MSHVQAGGATTITPNVPGKRLGVKKFAGEGVVNGNIIVKQRGAVFHPGKNVKMGNDFSIYAVADGVVKFRRMKGVKRNKYFVDVVAQN